MPAAHVLLDRDFIIGETDRRLFGAFIEHLGRSVYGGIFEPGHPEADARGFRRDVLALVRELAPTIMRDPGASFASGYNWRTGSARSSNGHDGSTSPGCRPSPTASGPTNTRENPERVKPAALAGVAVEDHRLRATLAPASWNVIRLSPASSANAPSTE